MVCIIVCKHADVHVIHIHQWEARMFEDICTLYFSLKPITVYIVRKRWSRSSDMISVKEETQFHFNLYYISCNCLYIICIIWLYNNRRYSVVAVDTQWEQISLLRLLPYFYWCELMAMHHLKRNLILMFNNKCWISKRQIFIIFLNMLYHLS